MSFRSYTCHVARALAVVSAFLAAGAQAFTITSLTPQSEVSRVRQVVAKFSENMVDFGNPRYPAPLQISCTPSQTTQGQGRWTSAREWVYDFAQDLPPGVRCTASAIDGLKSISGTALTGTARFQFHTGGPFVQSIRPSTYQRIEEEQVFLLRLNGPATAESIQRHVWCSVEGLGERVPVRLVDGEQRDQILQATKQERLARQEPERFHAVSCNRRFTPATRVQVVYGQGVATPSGIANRQDRRFAFQVREPFTASISCERENAQASCMPIRPVVLKFSTAVERAQLQKIRLRSDQGEHLPTLADQTGSAAGNTTPGAPDDLLDRIQFAAPLPEQSTLTLALPPDLRDASGRALSNADAFPLKIETAAMPPLAKFAAAPFGIVERFAEGPDSQPVLPVTLRSVEPSLALRDLQIGRLQADSDAEIIRWYRRLQRYDTAILPRKLIAQELKQPLPPPIDENSKTTVQSRMVSLLAEENGVQTHDIPAPSGSGPARPFEVIGVPVTPGFHVFEIASRRLGQSLLDEKFGADRTMYVRSSALVTNLAVHFKLGRENALAWVTSLDKGQPVAGATVRVSDCRGRELALASTDEQGIARFEGLSPDAPGCVTHEDDYSAYPSGYFVSARAQQAGIEDMAFTWSSWQKGIEPWRFNVPTSSDPKADVRMHTVFDRTLFRAGETVSMKHFVRAETSAGFSLPARQPQSLVITHVGSGQEYTQPLQWRDTPSGGRSAESTFTIPQASKLGLYQITLRQAADRSQPDDYDRSFDTGQFRVEEFRLPILQGQLATAVQQPLVAAKKLPVNVQIGYVSGGPAADLPVQVSALARAKYLNFPDYDQFRFDVPRPRGDLAELSRSPESDGEGEEEAASREDQRVVADKLAVTLDHSGQGQVLLDELPSSPRPQDLLLEATYPDPNGEIQTIRSQVTLWPAGVVAGIKTENWVSAKRNVQVQAIALDLSGKPKAGVPLDVRAISRVTTTSRKRMVGGFYTYDNQTQTKDLGVVCTGTSNAQGVLHCDVLMSQPGEIELVAKAYDEQGRGIEAAHSVWVTNQGELWFGGENHDRMDVLPEKKRYLAGETARFQVRMPFRHATALVTLEREGIAHSRIVQLHGKDPSFELKVEEDWGPNMYVSVLALRGRLHEVPWYSFFTWGYKTPRQWWQAYRQDGKDYAPPTALVDLSKPAFRLGMAEIQVDPGANRLEVTVQADNESYPVRATAKVTITGKLPNGQPAAHAEVALAAVDQALLELMPNESWKLLEAMMERRAWGVATATAQMEIIGRRHYGRKAVPTGGDGGGKSSTRELFDTLLLWNPRVQLDERGQAVVDIPLNDSLTTFQIVAIADAGPSLFGTGKTAIRATQDLQIISGVPPLVREGDRLSAMLTLRNTTGKAMTVELTPRATLLSLAPQTVDLPAGQAREIQWDVTVPAQGLANRLENLEWHIEARDTQGDARDALTFSQRIIPAVPLSVQQATLVQLDPLNPPYTIEVAPPHDALPAQGVKHGGIRMSLQPSLAAGLPAVRDWFTRYPYTCLEQTVSKSIGLRDTQLWQQTLEKLPAYLDADGLASYFPPRAGDAHRGSDILTSWLLAATHESSRIHPAFSLPEGARTQMIEGLSAFVEGRIERKFWAPRYDLDVRKLAAIEALSRHDAARPAMLSSVRIAPNEWPTSAVIDWLGILQRLTSVPNRDQHLQQAEQILRSRLSHQGTRMGFSTEQEDHWWWLMAGGDVNSARLLLTVMNDPHWKDDLGRLVTGFIARQQHGAWNTTTANLWGSLALESFSRQHESTPVSGVTQATLDQASAQIDWQTLAGQSAPSRAPALGPVPAPSTTPRPNLPNEALLPWPEPEPESRPSLVVTHEGTGKPWLSLQSLAAVELKEAFSSGYRIKKTVTPVEQSNKALPAGQYTRGDILRVTLEVTGVTDMTWVAITDPVPTGSTLLGSGLGRDSLIATQGERNADSRGWPAFEERSFESFRSYYEYLPKGTVKVEYTLRLNNAGTFRIPPTRVEALYAPEMFGEAPNTVIQVLAP